MSEASDKRAALKKLLEEDATFPIVGAFNALCAKIIERRGFRVAYVSGGASAAGIFGLPDIGLYSADELIREAGYIASSTSLPVISDADTGFGNVQRTVRAFEAGGIAGIHLEDQQFPKRCGHLDGKQVVSRKEMVEKIRIAAESRTDERFLIIARCDAFAAEGLEGVIERCQAYEDAGAKMIFPEALPDLAAFRAVADAVRAPVLANMTEFGKTPLYSLEAFRSAGCKAVLFPLTLFRTAMQAADEAAAKLLQEGTQSGFVDRMQTREALYDLLDYQV